MMVLSVMFWLAAGSVVYPYLVYPVILYVQARLRPRPPGRGRAEEGLALPSVSVVLAVHNEEARVAERLSGLASQIRDLKLDGEIIVVSDGSTDRTAVLAQGFDGRGVPVRVLALAENVGKAAALTLGCESARNEILALADARQTWAPDVLARLLENFDDPEVGAVSGELFVSEAVGTIAAVGLYWRFEKWLRRSESLVHSTVGLTGSISALRRELFRPIPRGIVLDDVYWPLRVVMLKRRVIFDGRAHAFDRLPDDLQDELRRKVRTLSGNYQLVAAMPEILLPWRNPVWFALISHKLMRLAVPWAALLVLGLGPLIGGAWPLGITVLGLGIIGLGLFGLIPALASKSRLLSAAGSFLALNYAAWLGFWVWASGRSSRSWTKVAYREETPTIAEKSAEGTLERVLP